MQKLAVFFVILLGSHSALASNCESMLYTFLFNAEREAWFRTNLNAKDKTSEPFLSRNQQALKLGKHEANSRDYQLALTEDCFDKDFSKSAMCLDEWAEVKGFNSDIGALLSQTDSLNRDLLQKTKNWKQKLKETKDQINWLRVARNHTLENLSRHCLANPYSWYDVDQEFFLDQINDAAVDQLRDSFKYGVRGSNGFKARSYQCRIVYLDGTPTQKFPAELMQEGKTWVLDFAKTHYIFFRENWNWVARRETKKLGYERVYLKTEHGDDLIFELISGAQTKTPLKPVSDSNNRENVRAYLYCK